MKKIFVYMLLALLLIATAGFVSAQETPQEIPLEVSDEVIDKELRMMSCEKGADYRFNQLIISLEVHIANAKDIVETADLSSQVKEDLSLVVSQLEELHSQASDYVLDLEKSPDVLASEFIAFRQEINSLTKEFRTILHVNIKGEQLSQLQQSLGDKKAQQMQEARLQIKENHGLMMAHRLRDVMQKADIQNADVSKLQDRMISAQERTQLMTSMMNSFSAEQKTQLRAQIHKENKELREQAFEHREQVREQINQASGIMSDNLDDLRSRIGRFI